MHARIATPVAAAAALVAMASNATADTQDTGRVAAAESLALVGSDYGSARSKANDWMIMPGGTTTLGGSMQFVTAHAGLGDDQLRFTDIVMMSVHARRAFGKRYEVFGSATFLPKQPSFTDELVWQGASAGMRVGVGDRYAAYLSGAGGPLLGDSGNWAAGAVGAQVRKSLHSTLVVEGAGGLAYTSLIEDARDDPSRLVEATASGELVFRAPNGISAGWIGTEFRFPVIDYSSMSDFGVAPYDPQTRVNVHLGVVLSYIDDWDIFAKYVIVDRGDQVDPTTTLPILDGGFDQQQLIIGLTRRFRPGKSDPDRAYLAE